MAIWLPGYARHVFSGRTGFQFDYMENPKLCWHTTEGSSVGGALGAYAPYPPHAIVNPWTGEKLQHISMDLAAYSAMDNNDRQHIIQFEVVGFANDSHNWPEWVLKWLGENVVKPVRDAVGVPNEHLRFYGSGEGIVLASPNSPIRLGPSALRNYAGHVGHQHLSSPDSHWDPGRLPIAKILAYSGSSAPGGGGTGDDFLMALDEYKQNVIAFAAEQLSPGKEGLKPPGKAWEDQAAHNRAVEARLDALTAVLSKIAWKLEVDVPDPLPGRKVHTVVAGDTLYALSRKYGVSVAEIQSWNGLGSGVVLVIGRELFVSAA